MAPNAWVVLSLVVIGLILGSFYATVIYRLPLGKSVAKPRSACPHCLTVLAWWDLVPLLSFLVLKGRCRTCGHRISYRYPLVELTTGFMFAGVYLLSESWPRTIVGLTLFSFLLILSLIDWEHMILPDRLTISGAAIGLVFSVLGWSGISVAQSLVGWMIGAAVVLGISVVTRGGMGGGDIKLLGMIGAFVGPVDAVIILFLASFMGAVVGIFWVATGRRRRSEPLPFGPFLALGAATSWSLPNDIAFSLVPFFS